MAVQVPACLNISSYWVPTNNGGSEKSKVAWGKDTGEGKPVVGFQFKSIITSEDSTVSSKTKVGPSEGERKVCFVCCWLGY